MKEFKDNFSNQSDEYLKYRPTYPDELFQFLASLTKDHELAWDCGTGNGQAAMNLAEYFGRIYASDASAKQISNAKLHDKISYHIETAEQSSLENQSVDLITVAIALHWFNLDSFYDEVRRVLKPDGVIAAWTYRLPEINPGIDQVLKHFHDEVVDDYWLEENRLVSDGYQTIPFPFEEIEAPLFMMTKHWDLSELIGLVSSWSAIQRIIKETGKNPTLQLEADLRKVWGNESDKKEVRWNLILKVGHNKKK